MKAHASAHAWAERHQASTGTTIACGHPQAPSLCMLPDFISISTAPPAAACRCDEIADESVELQVLRGLLTATTATTYTVHGQALLLAVRTCYNIYLMSRSEVNQTTAKATLTQVGAGGQQGPAGGRGGRHPAVPLGMQPEGVVHTHAARTAIEGARPMCFPEAQYLGGASMWQCASMLSDSMKVRLAHA